MESRAYYKYILYVDLKIGEKKAFSMMRSYNGVILLDISHNFLRYSITIQRFILEDAIPTRFPDEPNYSCYNRLNKYRFLSLRVTKPIARDNAILKGYMFINTITYQSPNDLRLWTKIIKVFNCLIF